MILSFMEFITTLLLFQGFYIIISLLFCMVFHIYIFIFDIKISTNSCRMKFHQFIHRFQHKFTRFNTSFRTKFC